MPRLLPTAPVNVSIPGLSLFLSSLRFHYPVISVQVSRGHLTPPISKAAFLFLLPKPPKPHSLLCLGKDTSTLLLFQGKPCSQSLTLSFSHTLPPICQELLLGLPSKQAKNLKLSTPLMLPQSWSEPSLSLAQMTPEAS